MDEPEIDAVPIAHQEIPNDPVADAVPCAIDDFVADTSDEPVVDIAPNAINDFVTGTSAEDVGTATRHTSTPSVAMCFL